VAWWLYYQAKKSIVSYYQILFLIFETQSVFLGDITQASLESLLFDDFFNKGEILFIFASWHNLPGHNSVHKAQLGWRRVIAQGYPYTRLQHGFGFFRWVQERDCPCKPHFKVR
jgi:hypothetical protein